MIPAGIFIAAAIVLRGVIAWQDKRRCRWAEVTAGEDEQ